MKQLVICMLIALSVVGCTSALVNRNFQKPEEVAANNRAEWVPITKNQYGTVYFDPYQLNFLNYNTFRVPGRVPISQTATGNWIYELNCNSTKGKVVSTLAGSGQMQELDFPPGSVGYIAKEKICGKMLQGKPYAYISSDQMQNEFYYSKNDIERNTINPDIYRFSVLSLSTTNSNWSSGQIEINCKDETSRPDINSRWAQTAKRSPANVLIYQFCKTNRIASKSYGSTVGIVASTNNPVAKTSDSSMAEYLDRLNKNSQPNQKPPEKARAHTDEGMGLPAAKKDTFDPQQLYKN